MARPKNLLLALFMVAGLGLLVIGLIATGNPSFAQDGPDSTDEPTDATAEPTDDNPTPDDPLLARGQYLVRVVAACQDCHFGGGDFNAVYEDPMGISLAGGYEIGFNLYNPEAGTINQEQLVLVYAPNLTMLGEWTDEQIENAIRYGVRPDGSALLPPMPYEAYAGMSDEDMTAIIAYLRTLEPEESEILEPVLPEGITRDAVRTAPEFDPEAEFPAVDMADPVVYGRYLATRVAACIQCHGSLDDNGVLDPSGPAAAEPWIYSDGFAFQAPNLLQETLGQWTDDQLRDILLKGIKPDGYGIFIMPVYAYANLEEADVEALIAWIRSQP